LKLGSAKAPLPYGAYGSGMSGSWHSTVHAAADEATSWTPRPELDKCGPYGVHTASFGATFIAGCSRIVKDTPEFSGIVTHDGGATWTPATITVDLPDYGIGSIILGPDGFMVAGGACRADPPKKCTAVWLRPATGRPFVPADWADGVVSLVFSPKSRVYAAVLTKTTLRLFVGKLGEAKFTAKPKPIWIGEEYRWGDLTIAANGDLVAAVCTFYECNLFRSTDEGGNWSAVPAPASTMDRPQITFFGARAISTSGWESSDAGATWTRVPTPWDARGYECSEIGCVHSRGVRAGWQLGLTQ